MEYSFDFADSLHQAAELLGSAADGQPETARTVLYLEFVAIEVAMKALLERSGMPINKIKKLSHSTIQLLECIDKLQENGSPIPPHKRLSGVGVDATYINGSVGPLLAETKRNGSAYPNEIRYGQQVCGLEPKLMQKIANTIIAWCRRKSGVLISCLIIG